MIPTSEIRPQAVAGMFYPGEAEALRSAVAAHLAQAEAAAQPGRWPKAVVVPHAGYVYSGSTAAQAFAQLAPARGTVRRVVLLGPVHRVPVRGLALPGALAFETPLGVVPLDVEGMREVAKLPQVTLSPRAHAMEHSLEVQLPFLQQVLGEFRLLPLAVGDATPQEVAQVLEAAWGGDETLIVISSDLSHYQPYAAAQATDAATVQKILHGQADIDHHQACGATPVNGLLLAAPRHGLKPRLLKLCNSGDTAGDRSRVVGYASLAFEAEAATQDGVPQDAGRVLLPIARAAIASAVGCITAVKESAPWLQRPGATFVTLRSGDGELRGCIGSLQPHRPLVEDVKNNAVAAALHDSRFTPLQPSELDALRVEVSLLSQATPMSFASEDDLLAQLRPGVDGLVLQWGGRRATFLPQVWEQLPQPRDFLAQLKRKAGLPPAFWDDAVRVERYTVRKWVEEDGTQEGGAR
jgi:AmmeMemoRadiSam system protein B/AmmeMemoRadiSam system protein A